MKDESKTKAQLINELIELRQRLENIEKKNSPDINKSKSPITPEEIIDQYAALRAIIDNIPAIILSVDRSFRYTSFNKSHAEVMKRLYGKDIELGHSILDYMTISEDRESTRLSMLRALSGERFVEQSHTGADVSSRLYFETSYNPITDPNGTIIGMAIISNEITQRKRAEFEIETYRAQLEELLQQRTDELHEQKMLQHDFFEKINVALMIIDPQDGRVIDANPGACQYFGYSYEDIITKNVTELVDLSPEQAQYEIANAISNQKSYFELTRKGANNETYNIEVYSSIIRIDKKDLLLGIIHDSTERKNIQEQLRLLSQAVEQNPSSIVLTDTNGTIEYVNPKFTELTGYSAAEAIGKNPRILKTGLTPLEEYANLWHTIKAGISWHGKFCNRKKNGDLYWETAIISPVFDEAGNVTHYLAIKEDVTERKLAEDELYRSRQMLQLVIDNIPMSVFWKDENLIYIGCNQLFAAQAGASAPLEIIGKTDFGLIWKDKAETLREEDANVINTGEAFINNEEPFEQKNGQILWTKKQKVPIKDRDGKVIGLLGTFEDITEQRRVKREIEKTNEKLTVLVDNLQQRNQESSILRQMDNLLQVCDNHEEYFSILKEFTLQLFPKTCGALYTINNSHTFLEIRISWGEGDLKSPETFLPDECWALRRGQIHRGGASTPGINCAHIPKSFTCYYLDIPMMSSNESIGIFHIEASSEEAIKNLQDLAITLADHISLSLSNLKLRETLRYQSVRDPLTGLFNRRHMEESFNRELARASRKNSGVGIIMLDIDHFKAFNDTYGHEIGDALLRALGALLQNQIRSGDIACRYGGEEFILILPEVDIKTAKQRAEHIREQIKSIAVRHHNDNLGITVSIGISIFPDHGTEEQSLLKKADDALYQAKHNGRDRVEIAD